jgi:ketosteroid isomerase-like protein
LALLGAAIAMVAAGCSRESDEDRVRSTLQRFADATARKDFQTICDEVFATKLVEEVKEEYPCELALKNSSLGDAQKPKLEIGTVRVEGDGATADVKSSAANQPASRDTVRLIREGEEWRIISLSSPQRG